MWLRARGSIQEDTFVRDSVMIPGILLNGTMKRQDTYPEDEKRVELHLHSNMSQLDGISGISDMWLKLPNGGIPHWP